MALLSFIGCFGFKNNLIVVLDVSAGPQITQQVLQIT